MKYSLTDIKHLSEDAVTRLKDSGIGNSLRLLEAAGNARGRTALADAVEVEDKALESCVAQADLMRVAGVGPEYAELLVASGVGSINSLRRRDPMLLRRLLSSQSKAGGHTRMLPSEDRVAEWILAALEVEEALDLRSPESIAPDQPVPDAGEEWVDGVLRSLVLPAAQKVEGRSAEEAIDAFLEERGADLGLDRVEVGEAARNEGAASVVRRFTQVVDGLPHTSAELVIVASKNSGAVVSVHNALDLEFNEPANKASAKSQALAVDEVMALVRQRFPSARAESAQLKWMRHLKRSRLPDSVDAGASKLSTVGLKADSRVHLSYDVTVRTDEHDLRVVVDAINGDVLDVVSLTHAAETTAAGLTYMPDPVTQSDTDLPRTAGNATLNQYRQEVTLTVSTPANGQDYRLEGDWVRCADWDAPVFSQPTVSTPSFKYDAKDREFLSVNAYHWLDTFIRLIRGFNVTTYLDNVDLKNTKFVEIDAQGFNGQDNSSCFSTRDPIQIRFGEGGVPDAADMGVVVHEYVHALVRLCGTDLGGNFGLEHAFCDAMPAIFRDQYNAGRHKRTLVFPWDNVGNFWSSERSLDRAEKFDDADFDSYSTNLRNSMLGSAFWKCYTGMGGNDADPNVRRQAGEQVLLTMMEALVALPTADENATSRAKAKTIANALITADQALTGGQNAAVMRDAFTSQGIFDPP